MSLPSTSPKEMQPLPAAPEWPLFWLAQLNDQGASGPDRSCPAKEHTLGKGCFATAWAVPYLPQGYTCSVELRDAMCPSGDLLRPSLLAALPHHLPPSTAMHQESYSTWVIRAPFQQSGSFNCLFP